MDPLTDAELRKLREVLAKDEIREVLYRFCRGVDRRDPDLVRSIYHADGIDHHPPWHGLGSGYAALMAERHSETVGAHHMNSTTTIELNLEDGVARVETYYLATMRLGEGDALVRLIAGRYLDRFEKRDGAWLIAERTVVIDWTGEGAVAPAHWDSADQYPTGRPGRDDPLYLDETWGGGAAHAGT